jgi:hypothetical protein
VSLAQCDHCRLVSRLALSLVRILVLFLLISFVFIHFANHQLKYVRTYFIVLFGFFHLFAKCRKRGKNFVLMGRGIIENLFLVSDPFAYLTWYLGRIRVPPGGHFFTCITLFNGRVPPEVIGDYCDR